MDSNIFRCQGCGKQLYKGVSACEVCGKGVKAEA
jgi:hypothetical protein